MSDEGSLCSSPEEAETSIWWPLEPASSGLPDSEPAGRCGHVAVVSGDGERLVVIGGYNAEGILSDIWEFGLETQEWTRVNLEAGSAPPERAYFRGCAGPPPGPDARQEGEPFVYVFGGTDVEGSASNDVWCLDLENRAWHEVHGGETSVAGEGEIPCARSNHSMCRMGGVLAVHGGESSSGSLLGDLWLFRPSNASWIEAQISPTGPCPSPRSSHCLAYAAPPAEHSAEGCSASGSLVLFGGLGHAVESGDDGEDTMPLNDLWVLSPSSAGRGNTAASLEIALAGVDGGVEDSCSRPTWALVLLDGVGPSPRSLATLSPRPCGSDLFLFGGYGLVELPGSGDAEEEGGGAIIVAYIDDLWRLGLGAIAGSGSSNGGGDSGWVDEQGMGFAGESMVEGRNGHTLTWCGEGKLVLFGGFVGDGFDATVHVAEPQTSANGGP